MPQLIPSRQTDGKLVGSTLRELTVKVEVVVLELHVKAWGLGPYVPEELAGICSR